jgi:hypothetical protein
MNDVAGIFDERSDTKDRWFSAELLTLGGIETSIATRIAPT